MEYWIVYRPHKGKRSYVSGTNKYGHPMHTEDESKAYKFYDFNIAMSFFNLGYCVSKEYEHETYPTIVHKRKKRQNLLLLWKQIRQIYL